MQRRTAQIARWLLLIAILVSMAGVSLASASPVHKHFGNSPETCAVFHAGGLSIALPSAGPVVAFQPPFIAAIADDAREWPQAEFVYGTCGRAPPVQV